MSVQVIGIDHGNYAMKTAHFTFPSGAAAYVHEPYTKSNVLEYAGKYYVCGTGRQPLLRDKTETERYYLLTLAALAKELQYRRISGQTEVWIAAGLPLTSYGRDKAGFQRYLLQKNPVCFRYEGRPYEVRIRGASVFPQGFSALALYMELLQDEPSVILADIGGWTVDVMRIDRGTPDAESCRSLELGMLRCMDEIAEQIRRDHGISVTTAQIEAVLAGERCSMAGQVRSTIQDGGRAYTERLLSAMLESGFDAGAMPALFMGGGAVLLKRCIMPRLDLYRAILLEDE